MIAVRVFALFLLRSNREDPNRITPLPSMAGARLRQLALFKIVPYDFVEPPVLIRLVAPFELREKWRSQPDSNRCLGLERAPS